MICPTHTTKTIAAVGLTAGLVAFSPSLVLAAPAATPVPTAAATQAPKAIKASLMPAVEATDDTSSLTITAIPPRLEVNGKPGATIQKTIKVRNSTTSTQYFNTDAEDFIVEADGKTPVPVKEEISARFSLSKWLTISPRQFSLKPNDTQVLDVLIQIPRDALPGGHYAMIMHSPPTRSAGNEDVLMTGGSSAVAPKVGTLVYLTVEGPIHEEAFIKNIQVPSLVEFGPVDVKYQVENRSDIHIRPQASMEVRDIFGRVVDVTKVDEKNVFPYTSRDFTATYNHYWGFGPYNAKIVVPYGTNGKVTQALASFWIIPYRLIFAVLIALASVGAVAIAIRRHILHRNDAKTHEIEMLKERIAQLETDKEE